MKKIIILVCLFVFCTAVSAQLHMREVFAQLPDSVLPLMSKNNRLDCIDFIENGMEARVKNHFGDPVVLDSLTHDYLLLHTSESGYVEMRLLLKASDTLLCVNRTYLGSVADSEVRVYDTLWRFVAVVQRPDFAQFFKPSADDEQWQVEELDTLRMIRSEAETLPLMKASLSSVPNKVEWELQTAEFSKELKKVASRYLQPVICDL